MKKVIFGIFAHPDDEAFGPVGTLLMEKAAGNEVHLICATAGENGMNPDNHENLAEVRLSEWRRAGELIGADSMHHLGYTDGTLQNNQYLEIAVKINEIIGSTIKDRDDIEIELMSFDLNGVTGHIDHIIMSRVACYVFSNMKNVDKRVTRLRLACVSQYEFPTSNCDWLYMDAGRDSSEIDETIDAHEHLETIYKVMAAHSTQRDDASAQIERSGDNVAINYFVVIT